MKQASVHVVRVSAPIRGLRLYMEELDVLRYVVRVAFTCVIMAKRIVT